MSTSVTRRTTRTRQAATKRAPQKRAEETRELLLDAGIELFSSLGFEGVSVRTIESTAGVQRGLVAYHFDTKEAFWRQVVDRVFTRLADRNARTFEVIKDLPLDERLQPFVATFVRFSAEVPQLNRLMVQEGKMASWRMDYIVDTHVSKTLAEAREIFGIEVDAHGYYLMVGAGAFVFSVEHECKKLFGIDPMSDDFVNDHAQMVAGLIAGRQN
ncbi:TetR/AcrR family transcriptional regulator [Pyruvatibacter sp.]|uniref:TetR/AcrR family transcriptional regulator n=1 Tax=Pyruvatibacter sp. TaxID=1981328 RepID=UPI0032ECC8C1